MTLGLWVAVAFVIYCSLLGVAMMVPTWIRWWDRRTIRKDHDA